MKKVFYFSIFILFYISIAYGNINKKNCFKIHPSIFLSPKTYFDEINNDNLLIKNEILTNCKFLVFLDKSILDFERNERVEFEELTKEAFYILKKDNVTLSYNKFYSIFGMILNNLFQKFADIKHIQNAIYSSFDFLTRYHTDFARLFIIHKELASLLNVGEDYIKYKHVPKNAIYTQDFSYYLDLKLRKRYEKISKFSEVKKYTVLPILIDFVYKKEIKNGFITKAALNISESIIQGFPIILNEPMFFKLLLGYSYSEQIESYSKLKNELANIFKVRDDLERAFSFLYVTEGNVVKRSSAFLDFSRIPANEIGVLYLTDSEKKMMLLPNPYPYFNKHKKHMVLSSAVKLPQSLTYDSIKDLFVLMRNLIFSGYYIGFNGKGKESGSTIEERQHFQLYNTSFPIHSLRCEDADDFLIETGNGVKIGVTKPHKNFFISSIILDSNELDVLCEHAYKLTSFLDNNNVFYNAHWNVVKDGKKYKYILYLVLVNEKGEGNEIFGLGKGVTFTGGVFTPHSSILMIKNIINGKSLYNAGMIKAASRIYCGLLSPLYGNLKERGFALAVEVLKNKIEEDSYKKDFWYPYIKINEEEKRAVLEYIFELINFLNKKGYSNNEISNGLNIDDYIKMDLISDDFISQVKNTFELSVFSFEQTKKILCSYLMKFRDIKETSIISNFIEGEIFNNAA